VCVCVCVCVCVIPLPNNFWNSEPIFMRLGMRIMPAEAISRRNSQFPLVSNTNNATSRIIKGITLILHVHECLNHRHENVCGYHAIWGYLKGVHHERYCFIDFIRYTYENFFLLISVTRILVERKWALSCSQISFIFCITDININQFLEFFITRLVLY
jgi:hypothetical protein